MRDRRFPFFVVVVVVVAAALVVSLRASSL